MTVSCNRNILWTIVAWLISIAGAILQSYYISDQYFRYETVTQVTVSPPSLIRPPKLSICSIPPLSLRDYPPRLLQEVLSNCKLNISAKVYKYEHGHDFNEYFSNDDNVLSNGAYLKHQLFCQTIDVNFNFTNYRRTNYKDPSMLYELSISDSLSGHVILSNNVNSFVYGGSHELTFYGKDNSPVLVRKVSNDLRYQSFRIGLSYSRYRTSMLRYPYHPRCEDYRLTHNVESQAHCFDKCVLEEGRWKIEMTSPFVLIDNSSVENPTFLKERLFRNSASSTAKEEKFATLRQIEANCHNKVCAFSDCKKDSYILSLVYKELATTPGIAMFEPDRPDIITIFTPKISGIDYITYVLSCLGFWFGFSPLMFLTKSWFAKRTKNTIFKCKSGPCIEEVFAEIATLRRQHEVWLKQDNTVI